MKRIFICSPLRPSEGRTLEQNLELARRLCRAVAINGDAPYAPHVFCTQFLDEGSPLQRMIGQSIGSAWLTEAHEVWVYDRIGISEGMRAEIKLARLRSIPVFLSKTGPAFMSPFDQVQP